MYCLFVTWVDIFVNAMYIGEQNIWKLTYYGLVTP